MKRTMMKDLLMVKTHRRRQKEEAPPPRISPGLLRRHLLLRKVISQSQSQKERGMKENNPPKSWRNIANQLPLPHAPQTSKRAQQWE